MSKHTEYYHFRVLRKGNKVSFHWTSLDNEAFFKVQKKPNINPNFQVIENELTADGPWTSLNVNRRNSKSIIFLSEIDMKVNTLDLHNENMDGAWSDLSKTTGSSITKKRNHFFIPQKRTI